MLVSSFASATQVLLETEADSLLSVPDLVKSDLSSPADRRPGRGRKGSAWLLAPSETQPCPGAAPGHISDPVASQSGGPRWQPRVLTASVRWCGVPQTKRAGPHATPCHFCGTEETLKALDVCGTKWLLQSLECRLSSLFLWGGVGWRRWGRPWERNFGLLRLHTPLDG